MSTGNKIGENIKEYRAKLGLSQEGFAQKADVKYTTLTKIESNVIRKPSVLLMAKIAKALGVSIEELLKCRQMGGGDGVNRVKQIFFSLLFFSLLIILSYTLAGCGRISSHPTPIDPNKAIGWAVGGSAGVIRHDPSYH